MRHNTQYTGHTQKNGAVSTVNKTKPHHSFVYALYFPNKNQSEMMGGAGRGRSRFQCTIL
jgi:hypothetical protein